MARRSRRSSSAWHATRATSCAYNYSPHRVGLLEVDERGGCTANHLRVTPLRPSTTSGRAPEVLGHLLEDPFYRSSLTQSDDLQETCSATAIRARTPATSRVTGHCTRCKASSARSRASTV